MLKKLLRIKSQKQLKDMFFANTKKQIIIKILKYCDNYVYSYPPYNYRDNLVSAKETLNIFNFVNNYFYGSCHEITFFVKYVLSLFKIDSQIIHMKNHNRLSHLGLEIVDKNMRYFVDPTFGYYFYNNKKKILSLSEIQKYLEEKNEFFCNKKISLEKFKNLNPKNYFFFKKKKNFYEPKKKYLSLFRDVSIMDINQKNYKYKNNLKKKLNLKDYYYFKKNNFKFNKLLSVKSINHGEGIINKKIIKKNQLFNFKNLILKFSCNSKNIKIINFPYNILDIRIFFKFSKICKIKLNINNEIKKSINIKNNSFILYDLRNVCKEPLKTLKISSNNFIKNYDIKIQKTFFQYENKNNKKKFRNNF